MHLFCFKTQKKGFWAGFWGDRKAAKTSAVVEQVKLTIIESKQKLLMGP